jgi:hypothetical protein
MLKNYKFEANLRVKTQPSMVLMLPKNTPSMEEMAHGSKDLTSKWFPNLITKGNFQNG